MENMVDDEAVEAEAEVEDMRRKRREAEPVVIPTHANVLPATTYHHLAGAYPVYYNNPYLTYPLHQVRAPIVSQPVTAIPFIGSCLRLPLMFLQLLRREMMNLLPLHYEAITRSCTTSTLRSSSSTQTLFNEI